MTEFIIVPGIGGSGQEHWQTYWQNADPRMKRFAPTSWDNPDLADWIDALDDAVARTDAPPVLVAHSLGCLLIAKWQITSRRPVAGAFLAAVPDPASPSFPAEARDFAEVPSVRLRFPALILASTDDPYGTVAYATRRAREWGCELAVLGPLGHINGASGLGEWLDGRSRLETFLLQLD